jgi:hypothetical protein
MESICRFLKKLEIELLYDPVIPFLGIYPKKLKSEHNRDTCRLMFMVTLFAIAKVEKQPRCVIYILQFYSGMRNNGMSLESKWMQLEDIMSSKVSRLRKMNSACFPSCVEGRSKYKYIHKNKHDHTQTHM